MLFEGLHKMYLVRKTAGECDRAHRNIAVFKHVTDIIALLAAIMFVMGISVKNGKMYRLWTLINTALWILYDFVTLSFGPLSTHVIQFATIIFGMIMHDRKKNNV